MDPQFRLHESKQPRSILIMKAREPSGTADRCHIHLTLFCNINLKLRLSNYRYHGPRTRNFCFTNPGNHAASLPRRCASPPRMADITPSRIQGTQMTAITNIALQGILLLNSLSAKRDSSNSTHKIYI